MFHPKVQRLTSDCLELVCLRTCPRRRTRHRAEKAYNALVYVGVSTSCMLGLEEIHVPTFRARKVSLKIASLFIDILITQFELKQTRIHMYETHSCQCTENTFRCHHCFAEGSLAFMRGRFVYIVSGHSHNEVMSWSDDAQLGQLLDVTVQKHRVRSIVTPHLGVMQTVLLR